MNKAHHARQQESKGMNILSFEDWQITMAANKSPHFQYCASILRLELICLRLVRAFREANFALYVHTIREILPWIFAMDHINYGRWFSFHYPDMCALASKHPIAYKHFSDGAFVVHKTCSRAFSCIP